MIRAYALGMGAGTQICTEAFGAAALGTGDVSKAVSLSAGWIINAAGAEWMIRRPISRRRRSARPALAPLPSEPSPETSTEEPPRSIPEENQISRLVNHHDSRFSSGMAAASVRQW